MTILDQLAEHAMARTRRAMEQLPAGEIGGGR